MKQYKKIYELKNTAKDQLDGKYKSAVAICLCAFLISNGVCGFAELFLPVAALPQGLSIPAYLIRNGVLLLLSWALGTLNVGLALFFLQMACGQSYQLNDLFYGFRRDSGKALVLSGVFTLLNAVCLGPHRLLLQLYFYAPSPGRLAAVLVALAIGGFIYLPLRLSLSLSYYLMLDFPQKTAKETLSLSMRLMRGQKKRLLYLECSFLPMTLLCVCTLFIGFLWLIPYWNMTFTSFYLDLMRPRSEAS